MPPPASLAFTASLPKARSLCDLAHDKRLRPISATQAQTCLHASLTSYVASWDSYIKGLVADFLAETSDPTIAKYLAVHSIVQNRVAIALRKFNAPNSDNARELLLSYTGYDALNDWIWPTKGMNGLDVRERLNEILKVRHSFAHGLSMPAYAWNTSAAGEARLTVGILREIESFFRNLVSRTDSGMGRHIRVTYKPELTW